MKLVVMKLAIFIMAFTLAQGVTTVGKQIPTELKAYLVPVTAITGQPQPWGFAYWHSTTATTASQDLDYEIHGLPKNMCTCKGAVCDTTKANMCGWRIVVDSTATPNPLLDQCASTAVEWYTGTNPYTSTNGAYYNNVGTLAKGRQTLTAGNSKDLYVTIGACLQFYNNEGTVFMQGRLFPSSYLAGSTLSYGILTILAIFSFLK